MLFCTILLLSTLSVVEKTYSALHTVAGWLDWWTAEAWQEGFIQILYRVRTENSFSHQDMGQSCPRQREKGVITSVSVLTYNHCTYFGYGHYEQSRSFTFEFWWRQNWLAFTQLWLTLHSCALYSVIVLLKLFMQIKLQFDFTFVSVSTSLLKESVIRMEI